ncbi:unnamed protein product [Linum trigynum]|uniref:Uncharacterized protein n=1 Tax=Linum trigynum TaxID=586398 RepID=A0AAV2C6J2_9ROSI
MIACGDYDCSGIRFCLDEATVTQVARPPHLICEASDELKEFETVQLSLIRTVKVKEYSDLAVNARRLGDHGLAHKSG